MIELLGIEISQQALLIGIVTGLAYAAFAAGFVLIYRSTGVLNFAHGEMGAFGLAVFVLLIANYGLNWWLAFVLAIASCAAAGAVAGFGDSARFGGFGVREGFRCSSVRQALRVVGTCAL